MPRTVLCFLFGLFLAGPALAGANLPIVVDTFEDFADPNPGDGVCNNGSGQCALRAAVQTANAVPGTDSIILMQGIYELTLKGAPENGGTTGDLDVTSLIVVAGAGQSSTIIDAKGAKDRAFDVRPGGVLLLEDLTVRNGKAQKGDFNVGPGQSPSEVSGGCIRSQGVLLSLDEVNVERCSSPDDGGCVGLTDGTASMSECYFTDCKAKDGGGAIEVDAPAGLAANRITIANSSTKDDGGAIETSGGTVGIRNGTFSRNKAGEGGAIEAEDFAEVTINNTTFFDNKAKDGESIHTEDGGSVEISNSLLRSKKELNCSGVVTTQGGNLENGTTCNFNGVSDCPDCNPAIVPDLVNNGGAVPTHAITSDSEAIDNGVNASCETTDARGAARVGDCDSGSYEFGGVEP
jgi:CSLREA domain-containing protein